MGYIRKTDIQPWEIAFEDLPADVQACFSEVEKHAYNNCVSVLKESLLATEESSLVRLSELISSDKNVRVLVKQSRDHKASVWFYLSCFQLKTMPYFKLVSDKDELLGTGDSVEQVMPSRLWNLYKSFDGISLDEGDNGGFVPRNAMKVMPAGTPDPDMDEYYVPEFDLVSFFDFGNGETAYCSLEGEAFLVAGDGEDVIGTRELDEFLDSCLEELVVSQF